MGYRSKGAIWLPEDTLKKLPEVLVKDLADWEEEGDEIYCFYGWKWYESYEEISAWNQFMGSLEVEEYDFILIGEDVEDNKIATGEKFRLTRDWEVI